MDEIMFAPEDSSHHVNIENCKILVVDDDKDTVEIIQAALKGRLSDMYNCEFYSAHSLVAAKKSFQDHADVALIILDVVMDVKDAGLQFVNYIRNELKNSEVRILIHTGQPEDVYENDVIRKFDINDYLVKTKTDNTKLANSVIFALRSHREVDRRVREIKRMNAELIQTEKLTSLGTMATGLAHELNNYLNFIGGSIAPLKKYTFKAINSEDKEKALELMDIIQRGVSMASQIIDNLKTYTSKDIGAIEDVDLNSVLKMTLVILQGITGPGLNIVNKIPEDFVIRGSKSGLSQLLMNLLKNSLEAISVGGTVQVTALRVDQYWTLEIEDSGSGISKDLIGKIFDPFFTTKDIGKGTGLGLFVVNKEVERHQGKISVKSEKNIGTKFTMVFPMNPNFQKVTK